MVKNASIVLAPQTLLAGAMLLPAGPVAWGLAAVWVSSQVVLLAALTRPRSRLFGPNLWRVGAPDRIALTFDDGPHPEDTPAILDILESTGARATFFFVGRRARTHPGLVRRVAGAGHGVGVHSDTHPWWFSMAGPRRIRREVADASRAIADLTGARPRFFRPPMGHKNIFLDRELRAARLKLVTWSTRPFDTLSLPPDRIRRAVISGVFPGGIVLLHEGVRREAGRRSPTVTALKGIIEELRARGLDPVSLEDLQPNPEMADPASLTAAST